MTAPREKCPTSDLTGDRHMIVERRWTLIDPSGTETIVCSLACVLWWVCYGLPVDVGESRQDRGAA
jgi:hypothetical protein